uniref:Uncharacterized protein n=1 Tax=Anopheles melas TaxID=34690 RepID=A0A182UGA0_9DIPT
MMMLLLLLLLLLLKNAGSAVVHPIQQNHREMLRQHARHLMVRSRPIDHIRNGRRGHVRPVAHHHTAGRFMIVCKKCVRTRPGLNSTRPAVLAQPSCVQPHGKLGRSTWHLMPARLQAHRCGSQKPRQVQPHTSREVRISRQSSFSDGSILRTPAALSRARRCRVETGCRKPYDSLSASEPLSLGSSSLLVSSLDELRGLSSCSCCRCTFRCSAECSDSVRRLKGPKKKHKTADGDDDDDDDSLITSSTDVNLSSTVGLDRSHSPAGVTSSPSTIELLSDVSKSTTKAALVEPFSKPPTGPCSSSTAIAFSSTTVRTTTVAGSSSSSSSVSGSSASCCSWGFSVLTSTSVNWSGEMPTPPSSSASLPTLVPDTFTASAPGQSSSASGSYSGSPPSSTTDSSSLTIIVSSILGASFGPIVVLAAAVVDAAVGVVNLKPRASLTRRLTDSFKTALNGRSALRNLSFVLVPMVYHTLGGGAARSRSQPAAVISSVFGRWR